VIFEYLEGWYNPLGRHSALGDRSAADFERNHSAEAGGAGGGDTLAGEANILAEANPSAPPVLLPRVAGEALLIRWVREGEKTETRNCPPSLGSSRTAPETRGGPWPSHPGSRRACSAR